MRRFVQGFLFASLASVALWSVTLLGAGQALACNASPPAPLAPSTFEGADGDQCDSDGAGTKIDWQNLVGSPGLASSTDAPSANDTIFGAGSDEEHPTAWSLTTGTAAPGKDNLLNAWTYADPISNDIFLYAALTREDDSGDSFFGIELNSKTADPSSADGFSSTNPRPVRSDGDVMLSYNINNSSAAVDLGICTWKFDSGSTTIGKWYLLDGTATGGAVKDCTPLSAPKAQGAINLDDIPAAENYLQGGSTSLDAKTFGEASVNLSQALSTIENSNPCFNFGSIWLHSRPSEAISNRMKDYMAPVPILAASCAVVGRKFHDVNGNGTQNQGEPGLNGWTIYVDYDNDGIRDVAGNDGVDGGGATEPFDVTHNDANGNPGQYVIGNVNQGTFPIREEPQSGWTCTTPSPCFQSVVFDGGQETGPTFGNFRPGTVTIKKQTDPDGAPDSFNFTGAAPIGNFAIADGGTKGPVTVTPNQTYNVSENVPSDWDLTSIDCSDSEDQSGASTTQGSTATVDVQPGENVTCTFYDRKKATVTIKKQTDPDGAPDSFNFTGAAPIGNFAIADGGTKGPVTVTPNQTYNVSENVPSDWDLTSIDCSDSEDQSGASTTQGSTATVDVQPGENVTCTFYDRKKATVTIKKQTDPDGAPDSFNFTGAAPIGNFAIADGGTKGPVTVTPNQTYNVSENVPSDWDLTSIDCSDSEDQSGASTTQGSTATVDVQPGENVTCTFYDRSKSSVTIEKETDPSGSSQSFGFSSNDLPDFDGVELTDGQTSGPVVVDPGTYSVSEDGESGWDLTSIDCSDSEDESGASTTQGSTATFDVQAGEHVICIFHNTQRGNVIVEKQTIPDGALDSFGFTGDPPLGSFTLADNQQQAAQVKPGSYVASEADPSTSGWDLTAVSCDDGSSSQPSTTSVAARQATFNVDPGETVKCVFTNTKRPPPALVTPASTPPSVTPGVAELGSPTGCVAKRFRVSVHGRSITSAVFYLDGKKIKTLSKPDAKGTYSVKVDPRNLRNGVHRIKVQISFTATSQTKSQTLKRTFQRCKPPPQPKFTG